MWKGKKLTVILQSMILNLKFQHPYITKKLLSTKLTSRLLQNVDRYLKYSSSDQPNCSIHHQKKMQGIVSWSPVERGTRELGAA
jgi:hypothetical protein